jgi:Uncharacterized protein conserved in bacteria (DUF2325)
MLHCSVVGTCLATGELREIVHRIARKERLKAAASDHELHSLGVRLAERRDGPGRLLHKALDRRHAAAIRSFRSATDEESVEARWQDALGAGAIPGAYWAALTHPCASERVVRRVFGEVHMLSHLVRASNRADIRRLRALEEENAGLHAALTRQRRGWREALSERDARLTNLERGLEMALRGAPEPPRAVCPEARAGPSVDERVSVLEARLAKTERGRVAAEDRYREALAQLALERESRAADQAEIATLRAELDGLQQQLDVLLTDAARPDASPAAQLGGARVLVVGARPAQIMHWRTLVERRGGELLHHDGGIDDNIVALGGLVSRADLILFPVDCVSHEAMWSARRLAGQQGKPYLPMRTASLAAFTHALQQIAERAPAGAR